MDLKKIEKKRKRIANRLKDSKGIICSETPTTNIILCNVGQATGLEKEIIHNEMMKLVPNVPLPKFIAEKGETYSYLVFNYLVDSQIFFNTCNGKIKIGNVEPAIYMNYAINIPTTDIEIDTENPEGLHLLPNFLSAEEERKFIDIFDISEENESKLKNRQVKHYGFEFRYGSNDVDLNEPLMEKIPQNCDILWEKFKEYGFNFDEKPDQLTVNKYLPGQGIPSHVDKHSPFGDTILSLSLGSDIVMDWRHHSGKFVPIVVTARSMLVMTGEARYDWQHGIQPRTWDPIIEERENIENSHGKHHKVITSDTQKRGIRISLTFRWTRSAPCECGYKTLCDSVSKTTDNIEGALASNLEDLHVHQIYEQIAGHFSATRHKAWPKVVEFMREVPTGAVVLDLGCGNGKNVLKRNDILQIAGERSSGLLAECKNYTKDVPSADCVRLDLLEANLKDACADFIICIAVIHHFSSKCRRLQSIKTIARLLRKDGKALITVWAKDQTKSNYLCKTKETARNDEICTTIGGLNLPVHENRTQFQHSDLLVPWKLRNIKENKLSSQPASTLLRYYHVFEENELSELCNEIPSLKVEKSFYEEGNWCVICKKVN